MAARNPAGQGFPSIEQIRANPIVGRKGDKLLTDVALDLSSSCVGWAAGANRKLERYGKFVYKSTAGVGEKLVSFEGFLESLIDTFWPQHLLIEKPMLRRGATTGRHHEILGIVKKVWFEKTGLEIPDSWLISPITVKNTMKVKSGANHDDNKVIMLNKVNSLYGLSLRWDANSKYKSDDDIADAIAVLTTYWRKNSGKGR